MLQIRVIPVLLLNGNGLVKTLKFKNPTYLGDPCNIVRIFNEKEVDELLLLDIQSTSQQRQIQFNKIRDIVSEAFMPVAYGGGVSTLEDAHKIFELGVEKIVIGAAAIENNDLIYAISNKFGSQSLSVCIDIKKSFFGQYKVYTHRGTKQREIDPVSLAKKVEELGAGEIIIQSIDRDGTMSGYDLHLVKQISTSINIPVVACGGAGKLEHFREAIFEGKASAVAAGSMFVFHGKHRAVLISYPDYTSLRNIFHET